ncbi:32318_t:CDS:2 [Gigaspora margarita]|uniref:32318_t:CDS:1 n=1 Tax=Gigaspora margarita TaxID=4874 RepID=A0ABN7UXX7_GIGMA|nr:32318_t:CDS:2 [Gigaspora margarita]
MSYSIINDFLAHSNDDDQSDTNSEFSEVSNLDFLDFSFFRDSHNSNVSEEPGYQKWSSTSHLNLSPIEIKILNFLKSYSSNDSITTIYDEVLCEF